MTHNDFTPEQRSWQWVDDDNAQVPTALENEDTNHTLANNNDNIRLRISIAETGTDSALNNVYIALQYDTDSGFSSPQTLGADKAFNYANGQGTEGTSLTLSYIGDAGSLAEFVESAGGAGTYDHLASATVEWDICIVPTASVQSSTTYYFRCLYDNGSPPTTVVPLYTGESYANLTTAATPSSHTFFKTQLSSGSNFPTKWYWNSGQFNVESGMCATSANPTTWKWFVISSSHNYFYPSGPKRTLSQQFGDPSFDTWIWVSGSYQGGGL